MMSSTRGEKVCPHGLRPCGIAKIAKIAEIENLNITLPFPLEAEGRIYARTRNPGAFR
jgi:hypothetical protein